MSQRSYEENGVEWTRLIKVALNNLRWIHPDVKITMTFSDWQDTTTIRDLGSSYKKNEDVKGIVFKPTELDK